MNLVLAMQVASNSVDAVNGEAAVPNRVSISKGNDHAMEFRIHSAHPLHSAIYYPDIEPTL